MKDEASNERNVPAENDEFLDRRLFLRSLGKWSGAAVIAAVAGGVWIASSSKATAGWINRRGVVRGGGWINGGGGGGWVNRRVGGGGGWINRW
jgi:hypothetical protein